MNGLPVWSKAHARGLCCPGVRWAYVDEYELSPYGLPQAATHRQSVAAVMEQHAFPWSGVVELSADFGLRGFKTA